MYERNGPKLRKKSITIHGKLVTNQAANQPIKQTNKINEQTSKQTQTKQSEVIKLKYKLTDRIEGEISIGTSPYTSGLLFSELRTLHG